MRYFIWGEGIKRALLTNTAPSLIIQQTDAFLDIHSMTWFNKTKQIIINSHKSSKNTETPVSNTYISCETATPSDQVIK